MTLKTNFCSSPWFHMEIRNSGDFGYCRWADEDSAVNMRSVTPLRFFQTHMSAVRSNMLQGQPGANCQRCHDMEQHHKVSGRQRQLLKTGVTVDNFDKSLRSSTYWSAFEKSNVTNGTTDLVPVDWQINLGNYCNSGCVFCSPDYSSRLAQEFKRLKITSTDPGVNWSVDLELIDQFVANLATIDQLAYLHFIGGETLITPAFKIILEKLISAGINHRTRIGFTTNLTVWDADIVQLLMQFDQVHLGMSIECLHPVNDYVRWPSEINSVKQVLAQWISVGQQHSWYLSLRTTPTALTVAHLVELYDFATQQNIGVESCNFLHNPNFLRMSVLPQAQRLDIADRIQSWIDQQDISADVQTINVRNPNQLHLQNVQDAASYADYLRTAPDETHLLPDLANYLKLLESSRSNSVLDYVPEYEHILRSAGY